MKFEIGDHVRIGGGKVNWVVHNEWMISDAQYLLLISPMSGRRCGVFPKYETVTLIKKGAFGPDGRPIL